jgi:hypothetical protein
MYSENPNDKHTSRIIHIYGKHLDSPDVFEFLPVELPVFYASSGISLIGFINELKDLLLFGQFEDDKTVDIYQEGRYLAFRGCETSDHDRHYRLLFESFNSLAYKCTKGLGANCTYIDRRHGCEGLPYEIQSNGEILWGNSDNYVLTFEQ